MKIAVSTIYGALYYKDKLFDNNACRIGENLLMPNILLKRELEKNGHIIHTADLLDQFDVIIFQDIPNDSWITITSFIDRIKYILKRKWKRDYLYKAVRCIPRERIILQINEPPSVAPQSYNIKYHKYFGKIFTWNDNIINGVKYIKFYIPQYWNGKVYNIPFTEKNEFVVISGNKSSIHPNELYTRRKEIIEYFEEHEELDFALYGFGWEKENYKNYKGTIDKKIETLSKYKFCFCFENIKDCPGYITEKIFDCFFAGCIPIYLGAENIADYIDTELFIDMRAYETIDEVINYTKKISETEYMKIQEKIKAYLKGAKFHNTFSCDRYIEVITKELKNLKVECTIYN